MKKKYALTAMIVLAMGMTACSIEPIEGTSHSGVIAGLQTANDENAGTGTTKAEAESVKTETEPVKTEAETMKTETGPVKTEDGETGIPEAESAGDDADSRQSVPILVSVESYEDDIIVVRDWNTDSILYFSTKEAEVIEGDIPIAAGEMVEITYRGVQGDKEHPGTAVKVVEFSMRKCTIVVSVESYGNGIIVVRDMDADIILYFSMQEAEVIEGDTPIAAGDIVEITYRGVQGDKENPGIAVKVVRSAGINPPAAHEV